MIDIFMKEGTLHEVRFYKGMIVNAVSFFKIDPNTWESIPEWLEKWTHVYQRTGEVSITGFERGTGKIVPSWLADWVYINKETGEVFVSEW